MQSKQPVIVAFDLEGTLMPEMWIEIAESKGIEDLRKSTADIEDYDELKALRVEVLAKHGITLADMQSVTEKTEVYEGARELLKWVSVQEGVQPIIVSDTFYQFVSPVMKKLDNTTIFCNLLTVDSDGYVVGYERRQKDQKRAVVRSFRDMKFKVIAIGDSFNDIAMFEAADVSAFYRAGELVRERSPQYESFQTYDEVKKFISAHI